ncbi:MAG: hypothetical protein JXR91_13510 [Deltaproteobacteria bacterium]|nr:hypothetical protein [Deltaproteobacteria bacterium]
MSRSVKKCFLFIGVFLFAISCTSDDGNSTQTEDTIPWLTRIPIPDNVFKPSDIENIIDDLV